MFANKNDLGDVSKSSSSSLNQEEQIPQKMI